MRFLGFDHYFLIIYNIYNIYNFILFILPKLLIDGLNSQNTLAVSSNLLFILAILFLSLYLKD